jgi:hypothetical protein
VVFVVGDFFWRSPILFGFIFVVASFFFFFLSFGVDKVFRVCVFSR